MFYFLNIVSFYTKVHLFLIEMQSMEIIKNNFSEIRNLYVSKLFQTRPKRTFIEKKTMIIYSVIIGFIK